MTKRKEKLRFFTRREILSNVDGLLAMEKYKKIEELSAANDVCIWIPESKTLMVLPLNSGHALLWLGADDPQPIKIDYKKSHDLARFVVKGRVEVDKLDLVPELDRAEVLRVAQTALGELEEPYKSRLTAFLLSRNEG
jgi:hypothetical protein